jgi:NAD-dependent DNA ligase
MTLSKELIYKIINNENNIIHTLSENYLVYILNYSDKIYYENDAEPIFSDSIYDILRNRLKELNPKHKYLLKVGSKSKSSNKSLLPYWMGSMCKFKGDSNQIPHWILNYKGPYIISEKLDGISLLLIIYNNKITMFTRGDGTIGRNISYLEELFNFENVLKKIKM